MKRAASNENRFSLLFIKTTLIKAPFTAMFFCLSEKVYYFALFRIQKVLLLRNIANMKMGICTNFNLPLNQHRVWRIDTRVVNHFYGSPFYLSIQPIYYS